MTMNFGVVVEEERRRVLRDLKSKIGARVLISRFSRRDDSEVSNVEEKEVPIPALAITTSMFVMERVLVSVWVRILMDCSSATSRLSM
jgi:hypothetical protein